MNNAEKAYEVAVVLAEKAYLKDQLQVQARKAYLKAMAQARKDYWNAPEE